MQIKVIREVIIIIVIILDETISPSTNRMPKGHNLILILAFYNNIARRQRH